MWYLVLLLCISSHSISVPNDSSCIISFPCMSGFGMLLLGKTQKKHRGGRTAHRTRPALSNPGKYSEIRHCFRIMGIQWCRVIGILVAVKSTTEYHKNQCVYTPCKRLHEHSIACVRAQAIYSGRDEKFRLSVIGCTLCCRPTCKPPLDNCRKPVGFHAALPYLPHDAMIAGICCYRVYVCPSVCHTPVLYQNA